MAVTLREAAKLVSSKMLPVHLLSQFAAPKQLIDRMYSIG